MNAEPVACPRIAAGFESCDAPLCDCPRTDRTTTPEPVGLKALSEMRCERCGGEIDDGPGTSFMASTDGRVWHNGCAPARNCTTTPEPVAPVSEVVERAMDEIVRLEGERGNGPF